MSDIAIRVENLGKCYRIGAHQKQVKGWLGFLRNLIISPFEYLYSTLHGPTEEETLWALEDVSFEVKYGEVVGIIGRNGAGKSTLLKILSRITEPTKGRVRVYGRVGSLLEVGTGFHPELTGRENVYMNGAILGMSRTEIKRKFDEIVEFAGVEKFIDTPVKRYSSGMHVRLGFAVAAHLEPEVLLVDEVLAVGDAEFQKKCLGKMSDVARGGRTVLFVSHNMAAVDRLCSRGLLLSDGACAYQGQVKDTIACYLHAGASGQGNGYVDLRTAPGWDTNRRVILTWISTHRLDGSEAIEFNTGEGMMIKIGYQLDEEMPAYCQVNFHNFMGDRVMTLRNAHNGPPLKISGEGFIECVIPDLRLISGEYIVGLEFGRASSSPEWLDHIPEATRVQVNLGNYLGGVELPYTAGFAQRSQWSVPS